MSDTVEARQRRIIEKIGARVVTLEETLRAAQEELFPPPTSLTINDWPPAMPNYVRVEEAEYRRLKACADIVRRGAP